MQQRIERARVLIVVKAYPSPSRSHEETVCTAGLLNGEKWIRIYPVPFRLLSSEDQFKKFSWVEIDLERRLKDFRPESHWPYHGVRSRFTVIDEIPATPSGWVERKKYLLRNVFTSMDDIIEQSQQPRNLSLAILKPRKIIRWYATPEDREFDSTVHAKDLQKWLFDVEETKHYKLPPLRKLPFKFYYQFITDDDKTRNLMIEDWEIGALFWKCFDRNGGDEEKAKDDVLKKCGMLAEEKDLYLIVGSTYAQHVQRYTNPFVIIGLFYPPKPDQGFFDF